MISQTRMNYARAKDQLLPHQTHSYALPLRNAARKVVSNAPLTFPQSHIHNTKGESVVLKCRWLPITNGYH